MLHSNNNNNNNNTMVQCYIPMYWEGE